ncbi:MAG TPA: multicopper oxidase domain-containing protein [Candidatus Xenobia bacterium]|nr:multicopper oxidase domain-containing protein [Candidatus Xenobia bacterium]
MTKMTWRRRAGLAGGLVLAASIGLGALAWSRSTGDEPPVLGMPEAEVFTEAYSGPPVAGEFVTPAPLVAPLPAGNRTHDVRIDIVVQDIEVGPGIRYQAWTFGGTVPGPVLHVRQGDRVRFTMKNRSDERVTVTAPDRGAPLPGGLAALQKPAPALFPMPHSMDFHAAMVAPDDKWRTIAPGQSIRFEWVANYPGVYTYHCGTPPVLQHVAMGQYGVVIVSPRDGFPTDDEIRRAYVLVQSEFYLKKDAGSDRFVLDYEAALRKQPLVVAFNGHQTRHVTAPLEAAPGDRVRLYLHNAGPNDGSSLHVIGTIFDHVWFEGNPRNALRGMQTVYLGASNGAVVEFVVPEPGVYTLVDHEFADATKGAVAQIVAGRARMTTTDMAH